MSVLSDTNTLAECLTLLAQCENSPSTVAVSHCPNFLEAQLSLQGLCASLYLCPSSVFAISVHHEFHAVKILALLRVSKCFWADHITTEAVTKRIERQSRCATVKTPHLDAEATSQTDSQVRNIDCRVNLLGEMVCDETSIREGPAEDIVDDQDGDIFVGPCNIGIVVGERSLFANRVSIPFETRQTTRRHCCELLDGFSISTRGQ